GQRPVDHSGRRTDRQPRFQDRRRDHAVARKPLSARQHHHPGHPRAGYRASCAPDCFSPRRLDRERRQQCARARGGKACRNMKRLIYELSESWKIAFGQMQSNKTRSMLTALGVIIGIVAVTLMGTAITGIQTGFDKSMSILGDDVLYV